MQIPFNKPYASGKEISYIAQAIAAGRLSGDGAFSRRCEHWLEGTLNSVKALLTHSCTAALEMAAILCELEVGDEVIMPAFTHPSTANAVVLRGATPVFVDIRFDTFNIDEKSHRTRHHIADQGDYCGALRRGRLRNGPHHGCRTTS